MAVSRVQPLLTSDEVSEQLGVPKATLFKWRTRKQGPIAQRVGKHLRWRQEDIDAWLDKQRDDWGDAA